MVWFYMFAATLAVALILAGHYERRLGVLRDSPRERIRIVPRTLYDEQTGVAWTTTTSDP